MPANTTNGFPYPLPTDQMAVGPTTLQALAQKSDDVTAALATRTTKVETKFTAALPITTRIQHNSSFTGDGIFYARYGPFVILSVSLVVVSAGTLTGTWAQNITLSESWPASGVQPGGQEPAYRIGLPLSQGQFKPDSYNVHVASNGIFVGQYGPGPQAAGQAIKFQIVYLASTGSPL